MKVSFDALRNSLEALSILANTKQPIKTSYRVSRVVASTNSELKLLNEPYLKLIEKHGGVPDEQGAVRVPDANVKAFREDPEVVELLAEQVDVWGDVMHPDLFGDAEIEPAVLLTLSWLISDGTEEPEKARGATG